MSQNHGKAVQSPRSGLIGWLFCDAVLTGGLFALIWITHWWHVQSGFLVAAIVGGIVGFISGFVLCFAFHEWGHWLGARVARAPVPFNDYGQALKGYVTTYRLIPVIDISALSSGQFLATSWGSVIAYVGTSVVALIVHFSGLLGLTGAAFAIGGDRICGAVVCPRLTAGTGGIRGRGSRPLL